MTDVTGATTGAVVWMRDVTGQQESLRALVDSERLFRTAFVDSPLGFAIADPAGQLIDVNPALCRMLGHGPGFLLQHGLRDTGSDEPALTDRRENRRPDSVQQRRLTAATAAGYGSGSSAAPSPATTAPIAPCCRSRTSPSNAGPTPPCGAPRRWIR